MVYSELGAEDEYRFRAFRSIFQRYGWLADLYGVDYVVERHWTQRLPASWRVHFEACIADCKRFADSNRRVVDLVESLLDETRCYFSATAGPFPLSIIMLRRVVNTLRVGGRFCRSRAEIERRMGDFMDGEKFVETGKIDGETSSELDAILPHKLRAKIKAKKCHEIVCLYGLLDAMLRRLKNGGGEDEEAKWMIMDVGAGIGHLSRVVSLLLDVDVATIEGNAEFVERALQLDSRFVDYVKKTSSGSDIPPVVLAKWTPPTRQLAYIKAEHEMVNNNNSECEPGHTILLGLHTCGDLSATLLRHFVANSDVRVLVNVGCCYHKLNDGMDKLYRNAYDANGCTESPTVKGYPLSHRFRRLPMSYASRELACFSVDYFLQKLRQSVNCKVLFVNCYRAALEWLILDCPRSVDDLRHVDTTHRHCGLSGVKNAERMSFWEYAAETLRRAPADIREAIERKKSEPEVVAAVEALLTAESERALIVYALRQIIAPLVETVIVEDRRTFLADDCRMDRGRVTVVALFDPARSPRNLALVAVK